jgi:hypothetical protein
MRRSRYDRRKSPLDAARQPHYGLSGSTLDAMPQSRYDRRKSPFDAARGPRYGPTKGTLAAVHLSLLWPKETFRVTRCRGCGTAEGKDCLREGVPVE